MELVSPNTKNFLFLTMSQFNDTNDLQRARVSMRRDQAFWQGGNSFLACEGFRISASPNPGGLYYKRVSDDYFIGVEEQQFVESGLHAVDLKRTIDGTQDTYAALQAIMQTPTGQEPTGPGVEYKLILGMNNSTLGQLNSCADPDLVNLAWDNFMRKIDDAKHLTLAWNGGDQMFSIVKTTTAHKTCSGPGAGPSQDVLLKTHDETVFDGDVGFASWGGTDPYNMKLRMGGKVDLDQLAQALGRGGGLSPSGLGTIVLGAEPSIDRFKCSLTNYPLFSILGPQNLVLVDYPVDYYDANGKQNRKAFWDDLVVGGWVHLDSPDGPRYKVRSFSPLFTDVLMAGENPQFALNVCVKTNATALGELYATKPDAGVFPGTNEEWSKIVLNKGGATLHFPTSYFTSPASQFHHALEVIAIDDDGQRTEVDVSAVNNHLASVRLHTTKWSKLRSTMRTAEPDHYFYTPNEFFEYFNRSPTRLEPSESPYNLNTDTNGGFVVEWTGGVSHHNFIISEEMCLALGLNGYFEYAQVTDKSGGKGWQYQLQLADRSHETADANPVDAVLAVEQLYYNDNGNKGNQIKAADAQANPEAAPVPFYVFDTHGTKYVVLDRFEKPEVDETYVWTKRYPSVHVNDRGDKYYLFHNMPTTPAIMRNDQRISIESYGTFCEINIVIPNLPFQPMLGSQTDSRILASLRIPFTYGTSNDRKGAVLTTESDYYGDLLYNSDSSRSYLKITTDQQLYDVDVEARLIRRDGSMEVFQIPPTGQFQIKLRFLQTQ